jgi:hypothetical protein
MQDFDKTMAKVRRDGERKHQESLAAPILGALVAAKAGELIKLDPSQMEAKMAELVGVSMQLAYKIIAYGQEPPEGE